MFVGSGDSGSDDQMVTTGGGKYLRNHWPPSGGVWRLAQYCRRASRRAPPFVKDAPHQRSGAIWQRCCFLYDTPARRLGNDDVTRTEYRSGGDDTS